MALTLPFRYSSEFIDTGKDDLTNENVKTCSLQQALAVRILKNEWAVSMASESGVNIYHLGGLPGAGKTATMTSLLKELFDAQILGRNCTLLCSKSNVAKGNILNECFRNKYIGEIVSESSFATLNKAFSIPVIRLPSDVTKEAIAKMCLNLGTGLMFSDLKSIEMVIIDEYIMSSARETVYIDALLRIIRGRPDVPFGGCCVIFLGDNRQNSAVVEGNKNAIRKNKTETSPATTGENNGSISELYSKALIAILQGLFLNHITGSAIYTVLLDNMECRKRELEKRKKIISDKIDIMMSLHNKNKSTLLKQTSDNNVVDDSNNKITSQNFPDQFDDFDDELNSIMDNEQVMSIIENYASSSNASSSLTGNLDPMSFGIRSRLVSSAFTSLEQNENNNREESIKTSVFIKSLPFEILVEEGLRSEIEHLENFTQLEYEEFISKIKNCAETAITFAKEAIGEIDSTGREKMYIVSAIAEKRTDCHIMSAINEEIFNLKLMSGADSKCTDLIIESTNYSFSHKKEYIY